MLAELLRTLRIEFAAWPDRALELDVFGTDDPAIIVRELLRFTREQLSASIAGSLFYGSSVGCTFGLELSDGRRVVIKARPKAEEHSELTPRLSALEQISEAMHFLRTRGYPCPEPILAPRRLGRGFATVEAYLAEGVLMDGFEPAVRRAL